MGVLWCIYVYTCVVAVYVCFRSNNALLLCKGVYFCIQVSISPLQYIVILIVVYKSISVHLSKHFGIIVCIKQIFTYYIN